jgi:RNA polymerase sigma factor (TIGR02999 family)
MSDITLLLQAASRGERLASEALLPLVYEELRRLATARMAREQPGHTLQATALVHEAWLNLVGDGHQSWENRAHFYGAAANAMRRILISHARRKARTRHGGGLARLNIDDLDLAATAPEENILLLNEAIERLEKEDPEQARIVVLKYFGGLTNVEVAQSLHLSSRTVERQLAFAKARLLQWIRETH